MTDAQIQEAIDQVKVHCDLLMAKYEPVSMRGALYTLGFDTEQADEVIANVAARGFDYCLDPSVQSYNGVADEHFYPSPDACRWGPDQLQSRLDSLRHLVV